MHTREREGARVPPQVPHEVPNVRQPLQVRPLHLHLHIYLHPCMPVPWPGQFAELLAEAVGEVPAGKGEALFVCLRRGCKPEKWYSGGATYVCACDDDGLSESKSK